MGIAALSIEAEASTCAANAVAIGGVAATACGGSFSGNDSGAKEGVSGQLGAGLFAGFGIDPSGWTVVGKSEAAGGAVAATNGAAKGEWSVDFGDRTVSTFAISLKAGNAFSVFLFSDVAPASRFSGTFDTLLAGLTGFGDVAAPSATTAEKQLKQAESDKKAASDKRRQAAYEKAEAEKDLAYFEKKKAEAEKREKAAKAKGDKWDEKKAREDKSKADKQAKSAKKAAKDAEARGKKHAADEKRADERAEKARNDHEYARNQEKQRKQKAKGAELSHLTVGVFDVGALADSASTAVPLPAAAPLLATGIGFLGLGAWRRRRARP